MILEELLASVAKRVYGKGRREPSTPQEGLDPLDDVYETATTFAEAMDKPWPITGYAHAQLLTARHKALSDFAYALDARGVVGGADTIEKARLVANVLRALDTARKGQRK